ncbi:hypothetical protein GCM10022225_50580 [Plantactinospora mayteni]|uniref:Uncharacterized protein n=1 Tax=Plantactinospora mayteni TaxID=566021 RepID=A0ABQ4EY23_9ACTN|nr:hypothetical protein Pma05_61290 [Plantactinospora mayteni]
MTEGYGFDALAPHQRLIMPIIIMHQRPDDNSSPMPRPAVDWRATGDRATPTAKAAHEPRTLGTAEPPLAPEEASSSQTLSLVIMHMDMLEIAMPPTPSLGARR